MAVGRKRKPDGLKVLAGTFRKHRQNVRKPAPAAGEPERPAPLTEAEAAVWTRAVAVIPPGVLTKADGFLLDLFARTYAEFLAVDQLVKDHGRVVLIHDEQGRLTVARANPLLKHRTALMPELRRLGEQLGLTPAARSKIVTLGDPTPVDPFAALMGGGGIAGGRRA